MDAAPRMPVSCKRALGRSATNEPPKRGAEIHQEERLTPPVEIFVRDLSNLNTSDDVLDVSSSAMTEITLDGSFCHSTNSRLLPDNCDGSVTSDVSSKIDKRYYLNSSSGGTDLFRFPLRRQSSRRPLRQGSRRGVMRWSSMPRSCTEDSHKSDADLVHSPRLPTRKGSNRDILDDSDSDSEEEDPVDHKKMPRLPTRKRSSDSLFSNVVKEREAREIANAA